MAKQSSAPSPAPSARPVESSAAPPAAALRRYAVRLHPGARGEFSAADEADAIAQYNLWSGVVASEHAHQVEEL